MRITKKWAFVAWIATASAVAAMGIGGQAQAAGAGDGAKPKTSRAQADTSFLARERAAGRGVVNTAESRAALAAVQKRVASYVDKFGTQYSFASFTDPATGAVVVESDAPSAVVDSLTRPAGNRALAAATVRTRVTTISDAFHRRDDISPFWGGAGLSASGSLCSSGYAVKNAAGTRYMTTAGHCYANGVLVRTESGLNNVGTVFGRQLPTFNGQPKDMELMSGSSYAGRTYTGGVVSTTSAPVVAAGNAVAGFTNYCHSGRTTGENCGHTATSVNAQVCTSSGCKSPVIRFTGGVMIAGGDSGGAFFAKDTAGGVWIRGHVIASGGGVGYAEKWNKVASTYGVSIVTG